jgi:TPP-dependent pyruvate/acetoin dehydrogenase alpha subunit
MTPSPVERLRPFRTMLLIRRFEERVEELRLSGDIVGSVHLCNGQEAIAVGVTSALSLPGDAVFPTYRGHGWSLACGVDPSSLMAELLGREAGINGGRGGSAYHFAPGSGMYGENSIVGAGTVIANGSALAAQFDGSNRVSVAVIGDGAMNQGSVHEALNFAAVRQLATIFIVENNGYSELTPISSMTKNERLYRRASPYGIPGFRIDGNDLDLVRETMRDIVPRVRAGGGPVLVEAMTERLVGHYIGDVQQYRPAGEVDAARLREPLVRFRTTLLSEGVSPPEIEAVVAEVDATIDRITDEALAAPRSDPQTALDHLHA